ncbi:cytochrome P450 [Streptomyces johnsoniae]|uniref:Cytochrome P450 n=1 Tax=Streptomyces johnsoniae TaxID=3075532 RepID=A0ABU2RZR3_9ACTN|nr:cytochrome P450 [Streptomyces sp. DSM 41886]MDT0442253.1 cytochrome P450 [Streptomyces sp. DSM 41886]
MSAEVTIPQAGRPIPFLGHSLRLFRDPLGFVSSLPALGDLVRMRLGPLAVVVVCDPELTRQVLVDDRTFDKGGPFIHRAREVTGDGLATCPHSAHRRQRRLCQPAFHRDRIPGHAEAMAARWDAEVETWRDGEEIEVVHEITSVVLRIAVETMFSTRLKPPTAASIADDFRLLTAAVFRRMLTPAALTRLPTPGNRRYARARRHLRSTVRGIVADRRAEDADHGDLLASLLGAQDPDSAAEGHALSDAELAEQVVTFLSAGTDTTASTLAWALHLLTRHPGIAERLRAEADAVLAGGPVSAAHVPRLELTSRVVNETLRLYPPGWLTTRRVTADTVLGGVGLPEGTTVAWSPYVIHRRPELYADPERFDPDRWQDSPPGRSAYIPFGGGARKCIAERFAFTHVVLALAAITSRWTTQPLSGAEVQPVIRGVLSPQDLRLRLRSRR